MNQKPNKNHLIAQQILEKMGNSDEFLTEIQEEVKPSRIESRREREKKHERKVQNRRHFQDWDD